MSFCFRGQSCVRIQSDDAGSEAVKITKLVALGNFQGIVGHIFVSMCGTETIL